jgi:hypothetical protein
MDGWVGSIKYNACSKGVMLKFALHFCQKGPPNGLSFFDYLSLTLDQNEENFKHHSLPKTNTP